MAFLVVAAEVVPEVDFPVVVPVAVPVVAEAALVVVPVVAEAVLEVAEAVREVVPVVVLKLLSNHTSTLVCSLPEVRKIC